MIFWTILFLNFVSTWTADIFKIALKPSSIPAKVSNFRNSSVSGKERARERKVGLRNLRASSLAKTPLRLVKPQNDFKKLPIVKKVYHITKTGIRFKQIPVFLILTYMYLLRFLCLYKFRWQMPVCLLMNWWATYPCCLS